MNTKKNPTGLGGALDSVSSALNWKLHKIIKFIVVGVNALSEG